MDGALEFGRILFIQGLRDEHGALELGWIFVRPRNEG